ncbi:MAG: hypothetical protein IPJ34_28105 [Myxococcales bacterium]|nr:hypothetical protein [Myxococcales bacterium]
MKVLVSTNETQGQRENDFCFVPEGELVFFGSGECSNERADGACGCRRSLAGVRSLKGTTTFAVRDLDLDEDAVVEAIHRAWVKGGFGKLADNRMRGRARVAARRVLAIAAQHRANSVLERRSDVVQKRSRAKNARPPS